MGKSEVMVRTAFQTKCAKVSPANARPFLSGRYTRNCRMLTNYIDREFNKCLANLEGKRQMNIIVRVAIENVFMCMLCE